ncbi:glutamyl-tRNA reductase [Methylacidiphilum kamchatkense Kam1]|uniref:Glutamyl-tRNA reductase n=1 Tax=Methylacidiphilum kamchatkense Kam1 TaxID=1202785 RepID=A0A0C1V5B0_9BACT|nr:glutamyl-tRNA reductase [Methylacidiphilum kamchatkense]KIE58915.1 glutamyl-tRNA reductase [Methylacidiphilum kamchatkense Kam1]QDQ43208.1 glutamyl-tRNA reductase [Methylacidiphilum kamchatkense Kam1]
MKILFGGGLSFDTSSIELREQVAFRSEEYPQALSMMKAMMQLEEAVLLSTCNRVEFFAVSKDPDQASKSWSEFLKVYHKKQLPFELYSHFYKGKNCIEHLFELASGLKSMVVGETEILGQLKEAYLIAKEQGMAGKYLNKLFQSGFAAAKAVRSATWITRGSISVSAVAVDLAEKLFGRLSGCSIMIVGAGAVSEATAKALQKKGGNIILVANRTFEKALSISQEIKAEAIPWSEFPNRISRVDILISSTAAPHYVITREKLAPLMGMRGGRPLFLIDLAVPRDIDPAVQDLDGVYCYNIDDLQSIADQNLKDRLAEVDKCKNLIAPHIERYYQWMIGSLNATESGFIRNFRIA